MFERFTDSARRVVVIAQQEARLLTHRHIGTEHLLLGLMIEHDGTGAQALDSLGLELDQVRRRVGELTAGAGAGADTDAGAGPGAQATDYLQFTPRAKKALELALREALQLGHNYIGTEHVLLGLVREGDGIGAKVLAEQGADLNATRLAVITLHGDLRGSPPGPVPPLRTVVAGRADLSLLRARLGQLEARLAALTAEVERLGGLLREHGIDPGP